MLLYFSALPSQLLRRHAAYTLHVCAASASFGEPLPHYFLLFYRPRDHHAPVALTFGGLHNFRFSSMLFYLFTLHSRPFTLHAVYSLHAHAAPALSLCSPTSFT